MEAGATSCGAPGEPGVVDVVVGDKDCLRTAIVYSLLTVLQSLNRAGRFGWPGWKEITDGWCIGKFWLWPDCGRRKSPLLIDLTVNQATAKSTQRRNELDCSVEMRVFMWLCYPSYGQRCRWPGSHYNFSWTSTGKLVHEVKAAFSSQPPPLMRLTGCIQWQAIASP